MSNDGVRLCEQAHLLDEAVLALYRSAFPAAEREPEKYIGDLVADGRMIYFRTANEKGELLCFSLVTLASNFVFLSYMATNPEQRSAGIGTRHMVRMLEILKQRYPTYQGLFFEIATTHPQAEAVDAEELKLRNRRLSFYERAGARVLCEEGVYLTPKFNQTNQAWEGELMGFEFGEAICGDQLRDIILEVYDRCYHLPPSHPMVQKVLGHFSPCIDFCEDDNCCLDHQGERASQPSDQGRSSEKPADSSDNSDCGCLLPRWWRWLLDWAFPNRRWWR